MKNDPDKDELRSFEQRIILGCVIAVVLALIGFLTSPLPAAYVLNVTLLLVLIAAFIFVFKKRIARFALAEQRFWDRLLEKWRRH